MFTTTLLFCYFCSMEWVFTLKQVREAAAALLEACKGRQVIAFHGEMGAGKTTFITTVCELLGVKDVVGSPTFSIINEYRYPGAAGRELSLYHMDLYRLRDEEEAQRAGVEDALYSGAICLVEWPEKAPGIFPPETVHVYIQATDTQTRRLRIRDNQ